MEILEREMGAIKESIKKCCFAQNLKRYLMYTQYAIYYTNNYEMNAR